MRFFIILILLPIYAFAIGNEPLLVNPEKEAEAKEIFYKIRCLVCQGESIADSNAELAVDIRKYVRTEIDKGKSEDDVIGFLVSKYGEKILMNPPFSGKTIFLWLGPLIFLFFALVGYFTIIRKHADLSK